MKYLLSDYEIMKSTQVFMNHQWSDTCLNTLNYQLDVSINSFKKLTRIPNHYNKNDKVKREAGGADDQIMYTNDPLSEKENNSVDKINLSENRSIQNDKNNTFSIHNNQSNIIFLDQKSQEYNLQSTKSMTVKQCNSGVKSTGVPSEHRTEFDNDVLGEVNCNKLKNEIMSMTTTLRQVKDEICNLRGKIYEISKEQGKSNLSGNDNLQTCCISPNGASQDKYLLIKQKAKSSKSLGCTELICDVKKTLTNTINCIDKRLENFEEYVICSLRNISEIIAKDANEEDLIKCIHTIQSEFEDIKKDVLNLLQNKNEASKQIEIFEEKLELLKITKADKDAVEEALMDKADLCSLNKKVSHDQFDAVCEDLERTLNDAITKLNQQESIWQQSFFELRRDFELKLNELEIPALKDYISNELQAIKNQLRILSEVKEEQKAAGARKLLRNLRCISCDKDAFMQTNSKTVAAAYPFPCRASIKPYLTFKMDQVRDKKSIISQKKSMSMDKFTNVNSEKNDCGCTDTYENITKDNFCDRYCGGSHTKLNFPQRATLLKKAAKNCESHLNMSNQHLVTGVVEGTDGRTYRGKWYVQ